MNPWLVLSALLAIALVFVVVPVGVAAFREWRRPWRLTCPRAGMVAQIRVGAAHAALAEMFGRGPEISRCSLWPPLAECREECLALPRRARQQMRRGEAPPRHRAHGAIGLIVVPLDGATGAEQALPAIAAMAQGLGATLRLLRVVPPVKEVRNEDDQVVAWVDQEAERVEREARKYLERLAARLPGVAVEHAVRFGDVATEVVEESEACGADLIAVPVLRRRWLGRRLDGGMPGRLQQATTIPLLVVPCPEAAAA
jgi:nucleotide-binding universal stress UspA family protein